MAKKKDGLSGMLGRGALGGDEDEDIDDDACVASVIRGIEKKFGKGLAKSASLVMEEKYATLPVSPAIDVLLGGGIKEGTLFLCSGIAKAGKTTLLLHFAANCQKPENGGRHVYWIDAECRLADRNLQGCKHLNMEKMTVISSSKGNPLTGERILMTVQDIIHGHPGAVIILDSLSSLSTEKEQTETEAKQIRNTMPLLVAQFLRKTTPVLRTNRCVLCVIQHLIANTSGYGLPFNEDGGNKIQYAADGKIRSTSISKLGDKDNPYGQSVTWQVFYSSLGSPGKKLDSYIRYGEGVDEIAELIALAEPIGAIRASGAWYYLECVKDEELKFKGKVALRQFLSTRPDICAKLQEAINQEWLTAAVEGETLENAESES